MLKAVSLFSFSVGIDKKPSEENGFFKTSTKAYSVDRILTNRLLWGKGDGFMQFLSMLEEQFSKQECPHWKRSLTLAWEVCRRHRRNTTQRRTSTSSTTVPSCSMRSWTCTARESCTCPPTAAAPCCKGSWTTGRSPSVSYPSVAFILTIASFRLRILYSLFENRSRITF